MSTAELGRLLNRMIEILRAHRGWTMEFTLDYLGRTVGVTSYALYKWRQGQHKPSDVDSLAQLVEIGVAEAGMDQVWAERVLYQGEHPHRATILQRLFLPSEAPVRHNLPRRPYFHLVGREEELAQAIHRLDPESRHWLVPIEGVGGVGKSALALEIGWRYVEGYAQFPPARRFNAVIWASAKREVLTTRGVEPYRPTLTNLGDVYQAIAEVLEWPAILRISHEEQAHDEVRRALRQAGRVLLILDNLETVDDIHVLAFLRDLPPPAKAVATMRYHEDMPYPVRLKGLHRKAARELVVQECTSRGITLSDEETELLLEQTQDLPLAIWWAVGLMGMEGYGVEAVLRSLCEPAGDLLRFIFDQAVDRVRTDCREAYHILLALSLFELDSGAALSSLAVAAGLDEETGQIGMHRLLNLNLVNRSEASNRFTLLPLTRTYAAAELSCMPSFEYQARERLVDHFLALTSEVAQDKLDMNPALGRHVEADIEHILAVTQGCYDRDSGEAALSLTGAIWFFLYIRGRWTEMASLLEQALALSDEPLDQAFLLNRLAWIPVEREELDRATELLDRVEKLLLPLAESKATKEIIVLNGGRGRVKVASGRYSEAERYFQRGLEIAEKYQYPDRIVVFKYDLALPRFQQGDVRAAEVLLEESETLARQMNWLRALIYVPWRQGEFARLQGNLSTAEQKLEESIAWADAYLEQRGLAEASLSLALVREAQDNARKAQELGQRAADLFARLGMHKRARKAESLLERLG